MRFELNQNKIRVLLNKWNQSRNRFYGLNENGEMTKFSEFFSKGGGLFLRGGEMVSHGDSTVKWAKIWGSDNLVETSVDSQWVTWSNTKNREKMNLTNYLALRLKWVQIVIWKAYLSSILKPKKAPESADRALSDVNNNYSVTWKFLLRYSFKIIRIFIILIRNCISPRESEIFK